MFHIPPMVFFKKRCHPSYIHFLFTFWHLFFLYIHVFTLLLPPKKKNLSEALFTFFFLNIHLYFFSPPPQELFLSYFDICFFIFLFMFHKRCSRFWIFLSSQHAYNFSILLKNLTRSLLNKSVKFKKCNLCFMKTNLCLSFIFFIFS